MDAEQSETEAEVLCLHSEQDDFARRATYRFDALTKITVRLTNQKSLCSHDRDRLKHGRDT